VANSKGRSHGGSVDLPKIGLVKPEVKESAKDKARNGGGRCKDDDGSKNWINWRSVG